jgi:cation transport ATPase
MRSGRKQKTKDHHHQEEQTKDLNKQKIRTTQKKQQDWKNKISPEKTQGTKQEITKKPSPLCVRRRTHRTKKLRKKEKHSTKMKRKKHTNHGGYIVAAVILILGMRGWWLRGLNFREKGGKFERKRESSIRMSGLFFLLLFSFPLLSLPYFS